MEPLLDQISGIATNAESADRPFRIVIIYENVVSAARALRACEILRGEIPAEAAMEIRVWKMSALASVDTRLRSVESAASADVVIVAASGVEERPSHFPAWVDGWLARNEGAGTALFTLLGDHATPGALSFASWLRGLAATNEIDFFSHPSLDDGQYAPLRDIPLLMPARELPGAICGPIEEWRPGSPASADEESLDILENFGAHLRARLKEVRVGADGALHQEKPDAVLY